MKNFVLIAIASIFLSITTASAQVGVKSAKPKLQESVIDALTNLGNNSTTLAALKSTGVENTLNAGGPYTIFAPEDHAYSSPISKADEIMDDKNALGEVMKYHVVQGEFDKEKITAALTEGDGTTELTTLEGKKLTLRVTTSNNLEIIDPDGDRAVVTMFDLEAKNGVAHVINNVLTP